MANEVWDANPLSWSAINAGTTRITNTDVIPDGYIEYVEKIVNTTQKNINYKVGDGVNQYQNLPYKLPVYIEISADTDISSYDFAVNGNELKIRNTDTSAHTVTLASGVSITVGADNKVEAEYNDGWIADVIFLTATDNYTITNKSKKVFLTFTRQATAKTITLKSAASSIGQQFYIKVEGSGAGNVSLIGDNINDISTTSWIWNGTGLLKIESNGTDYEAINSIWDSGSVGDNVNNINRKYKKYTNGEQIVDGAYSLTLSSSAGDQFTIAYGIAFVSVYDVKSESVRGYGSSHFLSTGSRSLTPGTTSCVLHSQDTAGIARTGTWNIYYRIFGTWA